VTSVLDATRLSEEQLVDITASDEELRKGYRERLRELQRDLNQLLSDEAVLAEYLAQHGK
jgi:hypothetical protein